MKQEILWIYNPKVLYTNLDEFFPTPKMNVIQMYNALVRFLLYATILFIVCKFNIYWVFLFIVLIFYFTYLGFLHISRKDKPINCRKTTINNPAANQLALNDGAVGACAMDEEKRLSNIRFNLYEDSNKTFSRHILDRAFYTLPVTTYPNDIKKVGSFMYANNDTCKNKKLNCEYARDLRFNR